MGLKETLDLIMQYPRIKHIGFDCDTGNIGHVELYPSQPQVQSQQLPMANDMPPDDVMMFAATEDVDELMEQRKAK